MQYRKARAPLPTYLHDLSNPFWGILSILRRERERKKEFWKSKRSSPSLTEEGEEDYVVLIPELHLLF